MPWVRIDEDFAQHPKVARAGPLAMALQVAGLCYCNRNLTDGFVPWATAQTLLAWQTIDDEARIHTIARTCGMSGDDVTTGWVIDQLVAAGMWEPVAGGYLIHDYGDYQPSKADVEADREQKREAGRLGGQARAKQRGKRRAKQSAKHPPKRPPKHPLSNGQAERLAEGQAESKPVPVPGPDSGVDLDLGDDLAKQLDNVGDGPPALTSEDELSTAERRHDYHVKQDAPVDGCRFCDEARVS